MESHVVTRMDQERMEAWSARLGERDMPVFAETARRITSLVVQDDASLTELVQTILRDSLMTARVLKVANSVYFQPGRGAISTISRAVVVMGFETVRALALSVSLVESLGEAVGHERVAREVARAFHAALHARTFAAHLGDDNPEEVYAAALLSRIGHIAFWCFSGDAGERLEAYVKRTKCTPEEAEQAVLGFRLDDLSGQLGEQWRLGEVFQAVQRGERGPRARAVRLGCELATTVEQGWDGPELRPLVEEITEFLHMPAASVVDMIHANAKNAVQNAAFVGLKGAGAFIPAPPQAELLKSRVDATLDEALVSELERTVAASPAEESSPALTPDRELQLNILWEISALLEGSKPDLNVLLPMVLEGIYRGIGFDRAMLGLNNAVRELLVPKYVLGEFDEERVKGMEFSSRPVRPNLFSYCMESRRALWFDGDPGWELAAMIEREVKQLSQGAPFYVLPICVNERAIGLIYADCQSSGRRLTEEGFLAFQHFGRQANLAFSLMSLRTAQASKPAWARGGTKR